MTDNLDIFISYADADAEWTRTWLLPKLESHGLRVMSANDLLAGGARIEQIAQEAERSKHTLLVLSPDWVANQWETFTGLIARSADPVGRQRKTIPLLREGCEPPRSIARLVSADFASEDPSDWEKEFSRLLAVLSGQRSRTTLGPPLGALIGAEAPTNFKFPQNRHFVGRDQELAELHDLLDDAIPLGVNAARTGSAIAGLTGLGGVGKTQLVVEYIHRYGKSYPGGIFWINAADGVEDDFVEIGRIISGDGNKKKPDELIRISFDYLRSDPDTLLVVDNLNEPALLNQPVAGILTPISLPCRLLFTTRRRDLRGLRSIAVDMLTEADSLNLLLRSRPAILDNSHPEHAIAVKLCATLGGLPLAIEMAAAYLEQEEDVTLSGYLKRLGKEGSLQTLDTLEQANDWSPTWHDPIQITLQSQWDTLTNGEARLLLQAAALMPEAAAIPLARLSLLTGLNPLAEEGYPTPLASALRLLHNYSLIEKLEDNQVRLHPLVREFALRQISNPDEFSRQCSVKMGAALEDMLRVNREVFERGVDELLKDLKIGLKLHPGNAALEELRLLLTREAHNLPDYYIKRYPGYFLQQVRNRAFGTGSMRVMERVESALESFQMPWLRERFQPGHESQALLSTFRVSIDIHTDLDKPYFVDQVRCDGVVITPDDKRAITVSSEQTMHLWDLESGEPQHIFQVHSGTKVDLVGMAITPDGQHVLCANALSTLELWDLESKQRLTTFRISFNTLSYLRNLVMSPDGRKILCAYSDDTMQLCDLETGTSLRSFIGHTEAITGMAITPDGRRAISASKDHSLRLWDLESGECLRTFKGHTNDVTTVAVTPDGKRAISGSRDNTLRLWDLENEKQPGTWLRNWKRGDQSLRTFKEHTDQITSLAVTLDGRRAISTSRDETLRLWDLETGKCLGTFKGHTGVVTSVAITSDGKHAISVSSDQTLRRWDLESVQSLQTIEGHTKEVTGVAITPDGKHAVSASKDKTLRLWDLKSGKSLRVFKGHASEVTAVAATSDGRHAISAASGGELRLWDLKRDKSLRVFKSKDLHLKILDGNGKDTGRIWTLSVNSVVVTPDGKYAISASGDNYTGIHLLQVWDMENGKSLKTLGKHEGEITSVAVTSDSKRAVSATKDGFVSVWDLKNGQCLRTFKIQDTSIAGNVQIAITPDDRCVLVDAGSLKLEFWDLDTGQQLRTQPRNSSSHGLVITANGKYTISWSYEGLALLDIETGQELLLFASEKFICAQVDKAGLCIVAGGETGAMHFLDIVDHGSR